MSQKENHSASHGLHILVLLGKIVRIFKSSKTRARSVLVSATGVPIKALDFSFHMSGSDQNRRLLVSVNRTISI